MNHNAIPYTVGYPTATPHGWFCWVCRADTGPKFFERGEAEANAAEHNETGQ